MKCKGSKSFHKSLPLALILSQSNPHPSVERANFNLCLCPKQSLSYGFHNQNCVYTAAHKGNVIMKMIWMVMYRVGHKLYAIQLSKYLLIYEMLYLHILQFL